MTSQDLSEVQALLDCALPESYIEYILSEDPKIANVFYDRTQIIDFNLKVRTKCWRGEPLDRFFYVFGQDEEGRVLFLDLDFPGGAVFRQKDDSPDPSIRSTMLSPSFEQWKRIAESGLGARIAPAHPLTPPASGAAPGDSYQTR